MVSIFRLAALLSFRLYYILFSCSSWSWFIGVHSVARLGSGYCTVVLVCTVLYYPNNKPFGSLAFLFLVLGVVCWGLWDVQYVLVMVGSLGSNLVPFQGSCALRLWSGCGQAFRGCAR